MSFIPILYRLDMLDPPSNNRIDMWADLATTGMDTLDPPDTTNKVQL